MAAVVNKKLAQGYEEDTWHGEENWQTKT